MKKCGLAFGHWKKSPEIDFSISSRSEWENTSFTFKSPMIFENEITEN
jgi:hypothetical protein